MVKIEHANGYVPFLLTLKETIIRIEISHQIFNKFLDVFHKILMLIYIVNKINKTLKLFNTF